LVAHIHHLHNVHLIRHHSTLTPQAINCFSHHLRLTSAAVRIGGTFVTAPDAASIRL
jgi:hypothetical protein